jgi:hypothetical protein
MDSIKDFMPLFGSILGILITGAIGVLTYTWQENTKRKVDLVRRRQELYEKLNSALFGLMLAKNRAERSIVLADIEKAWLFASDETLDAIFGYMKVYDRWWTEGGGDVLSLIKTNPQARREIAEGLGNIFLAMRRDLRATSVSSNISKSYMQFYNCGLLDPFGDRPSAELQDNSSNEQPSQSTKSSAGESSKPEPFLQEQLIEGNP